MVAAARACRAYENTVQHVNQKMRPGRCSCTDASLGRVTIGSLESRHKNGGEMAEPEQIREFVIAGHGNAAKVRELLEADPGLLNEAFLWREGDAETALQGASHVGNREIALLLLERGAPLEITTAAMLGDANTVHAMLEHDSGLIEARGGHGITLLCHAVLSGQLELVQDLFTRGATEGSSMALALAVGRGDLEMARWLVQNAAADPNWKNHQGKSALETATERGDRAMISALTQT